MDYGTLLEHFLCYNNKCTNRLLPENKGGEEMLEKGKKFLNITFVATSGIHNGMFHLDACIRKK